MTRHIAFVAFGLLTALPAAALADMTVITCDGPKANITQSDMTVSEAQVLTGLTEGPKNPTDILMQFETPSGAQIWGWTDEPQDTLVEHCPMQYYMKNKPLDGAWLISQEGAELGGCPEEVAVPQGLTGTRNLEWKHVFSPRQFFRGGQIKWDLTRIHQNHWTASARPIPEMPGTVKISYDFQVRDVKTIDIVGDVELKIDAGTTQIDCKARIEMVARHQG